jgi:uncharacterized protein YqhQ
METYHLPKHLRKQIISFNMAIAGAIALLFAGPFFFTIGRNIIEDTVFNPDSSILEKGFVAVMQTLIFVAYIYGWKVMIVSFFNQKAVQEEIPNIRAYVQKNYDMELTDKEAASLIGNNKFVRGKKYHFNYDKNWNGKLEESEINYSN